MSSEELPPNQSDQINSTPDNNIDIIDKENIQVDEDENKDENIYNIQCLDSFLTAKEVSGNFIQHLVVNIEELIEPLPEEILYQIDSIRMEKFFSQVSDKELLSSFPLLKMLYQKYVPSKINDSDFWPRFIWSLHNYYYSNNKQDFTMKPIDDNLIFDDDIEENLLSNKDKDNDEEKTKKEIDIIKLDYHSVNRYIASAILAFLKVFIVCAVLKNYGASWYYYLYPALWVLIGLLIILRALQIQKTNNNLKMKLDQSLEEGIELQEMESV